MKNFILGVLTTLVIIAVGGFAYLRGGFAEVRGDLPPSKLESYLMYAAVHASVRKQAPDVSSPIAPTDENLIAGGKMYLDDCAGCHGAPGKQQDNSGSLFPPIPQFAKVGTEYTEAQIFLGRETRNSQDRYVRQRSVVSRSKIVDRRRVHQSHQGPSAPGPGRIGQTQFRGAVGLSAPSRKRPDQTIFFANQNEEGGRLASAHPPSLTARALTKKTNRTSPLHSRGFQIVLSLFFRVFRFGLGVGLGFHYLYRLGQTDGFLAGWTFARRHVRAGLHAGHI
jgi:mono/diheme cytochrome c family protein